MADGDGDPGESSSSPPAIIAILNSAAELKSDGVVLFELKELGPACTKFEEALQLLQTLDETCPSTNPEYVELWQACLKEKKDTELPCHLNVAICKLKMEDFAAASSAASQALAMDEDNVKALFRRGS